MNKSNFSDLYLVTYLMLKGFKPVSKAIERRNTVFQFETSTELDKEVEQYYSANTSVDALTFTERYRFVVNLAKSFRAAEVR